MMNITRAVTFTPLAGLGDNYLQNSLLLRWAKNLDEKIAIVFYHDGHVLSIEERANCAIYVQMELLELLVAHPNVIFANLPGHYLYPYDPQIVHAFSPSVMFDREVIPQYWPLDRENSYHAKCPPLTLQ